jgi:hypothetical protein
MQVSAPATGEALAELIIEGIAGSTELTPFDPARLRPLDPSGIAKQTGGRKPRGSCGAPILYGYPDPRSPPCCAPGMPGKGLPLAGRFTVPVASAFCSKTAIIALNAEAPSAPAIDARRG